MGIACPFNLDRPMVSRSGGGQRLRAVACRHQSSDVCEAEPPRAHSIRATLCIRSFSCAFRGWRTDRFWDPLASLSAAVLSRRGRAAPRSMPRGLPRTDPGQPRCRLPPRPRPPAAGAARRTAGRTERRAASGRCSQGQQPQARRAVRSRCGPGGVTKPVAQRCTFTPRPDRRPGRPRGPGRSASRAAQHPSTCRIAIRLDQVQLDPGQRVDERVRE
jgi:hypothetical protein